MEPSNETRSLRKCLGDGGGGGGGGYVPKLLVGAAVGRARSLEGSLQPGKDPSPERREALLLARQPLGARSLTPISRLRGELARLGGRRRAIFQGLGWKRGLSSVCSSGPVSQGSRSGNGFQMEERVKNPSKDTVVLGTRVTWDMGF